MTQQTIHHLLLFGLPASLIAACELCQPNRQAVLEVSMDVLVDILHLVEATVSKPSQISVRARP